MVQQAQPSSSGSAPDCDQPEQLLQEEQADIAARPDIDSLHSVPKFGQDKATQCCTGATLSKSVGTQTVVCKPFKTCDVGVQVENVLDPQPTFYEECYGSEKDPYSSPPMKESCSGDSSFELSEEDDSISLSSKGSAEGGGLSEEPEYIVFRSCLHSLLGHCKSCGGIVTDTEENTIGSMLTVKMFCINGHTDSWSSQPFINRMPAGNVLTSAAILFSGNTFLKVSQLASFLNLQFFSHTTYYDIQDTYLFPVVNRAWAGEKLRVFDLMKEEGSVNLNGDGRCDSPGHSAKYGTYTMMAENGEVVTFSIVQVSEVTSSNAMEKEGFERCFQELEDNGITVNRVTTDRHPSIACAMDNNHQDSEHQYDVWHVAKGVLAKLRKKANKKSCEDLRPWIKSFSNHLWWCSRSCEGNAEVLREKWKSLLHHVTNQHQWPGNNHFHACAHPPLTAEQVRKKKWLSSSSDAYVALEEVVEDKKLLKDLGKLTKFCHTGELEVYHSMMLKYCPKRQHFSYRGMLARTQLAALDQNANNERQQATVKAGNREGEARFKVSFPKAQKQWVVKPIRERKSYAHVHGLMANVVEHCKGGELQADEQMDVEVILPPNIATTPAPSKQELIAKHRSRFH